MDDFLIGIQSDEIIPEEYEDWMKWVYSYEEDVEDADFNLRQAS